MPSSAMPEIFRRAIAAYKSGDLVKAENLCQATLKSKPDYFDALHLLGVVRSRRGFPGDALAIFDKALVLGPYNADLFNNRGAALTELKRYEEALASYDQALALRPNYADAHNNRGSALMELERYEDALASYGKALVNSPGNVEFVNNLGRALTKLKRYEQAMICFDDALALRADYFEAMVNRGVALNKLKCFEDAVVSCDRALALRADDAEALLNRADALNGLKRYEEALRDYARGLELRPLRADIWLSRGASLTKLARFDEALESFEVAQTLGADPVEILASRGLTLGEANRLEEGLANIDRAMICRPEDAHVHNARGLTLMKMERFDEAIESYRRAVELDPEFAGAELNLGCLSLFRGDFGNGWEGYEARRRNGAGRWRRFEGLEWTGEPLEGKRLLLHGEQAFGDAIQFVRFARAAAARGAEVVLEVHAPLATLLRRADCVAAVSLHGEKTPPYDLHAPLMSMPFILGLGEKDITCSPYLHAEPARLAAWANRLPEAPFRVGIAWQGSSSICGRAIPLKTFLPMSRIPGVRLISLQKTDGLEQLADLPDGMTVETLGPDLDAGPDAFLDTAAVMMNLDLIVSCDTGIAHLAGALGRPVWIVLRRVPEWRWMMDRPDSPWYPTARLFRCKKDGDWAEVMEEAAAELARLVGPKRTSENSPDSVISSAD
ncbi:MAG: tetratricopeptide repeat protein [Methylovirgula sp.]|jgi:tetratricopeptide (TPR) repeat protein